MAVDIPDAVRQKHPDGIDVLIDLVSDGAAFAALASLSKPGGTAVSTLDAANKEVLRANGIVGINFSVAARISSELLERLAEVVADGRIVVPPIKRISLDEAPAVLNPAPPQPASGKTVIVMTAARRGGARDGRSTPLTPAVIPPKPSTTRNDSSLTTFAPGCWPPGSVAGTSSAATARSRSS
jgi:hypothetical protein